MYPSIIKQHSPTLTPISEIKLISIYLRDALNFVRFSDTNIFIFSHNQFAAEISPPITQIDHTKKTPPR